MCEKKPSGKCNVPEHIHQLWAAGKSKREELMKVFEEVGENKDTMYWGYCLSCLQPIMHIFSRLV